jgi:hypothetical protein
VATLPTLNNYFDSFGAIRRDLQVKKKVPAANIQNKKRKLT